MPIKKRWSQISPRNIERVPDCPGAYELGDSRGKIVYTGSSDNLRRRLKEHKKDPSKRGTKKFRYECTIPFLEDPKESERYHGEKYEKKNGSLPRKQKRLPRESLWSFLRM